MRKLIILSERDEERDGVLRRCAFEGRLVGVSERHTAKMGDIQTLTFVDVQTSKWVDVIVLKSMEPLVDYARLIAPLDVAPFIRLRFDSAKMAKMAGRACSACDGRGWTSDDMMEGRVCITCLGKGGIDSAVIRLVKVAWEFVTEPSVVKRSDLHPQSDVPFKVEQVEKPASAAVGLRVCSCGYVTGSGIDHGSVRVLRNRCNSCGKRFEEAASAETDDDDANPADRAEHEASVKFILQRVVLDALKMYDALKKTPLGDNCDISALATDVVDAHAGRWSKEIFDAFEKG